MLYHGRTDDSIPAQFGWLAFDFEHAYLFCLSECHVLSFITTRPMRVVYLDGASAVQIKNGTLDVQDLLIWNRTRTDKWAAIRERGQGLCEWGKRYGIDGFVRMQMHL